MHSKKLDTGSKDIINSLPEALIYHILSFLPTKEAALTSVLAKKWRYLFALVPNLDFDDPVRMQPDLFQEEEAWIHTTFMDFVDRVLSLQKDFHFPVKKFSLKCGKGVDDVAVSRWIRNVLELGVSALDLCFTDYITFPRGNVILSKVFVNESLVRLRIGALTIGAAGIVGEVEEDVFLPKLKTLYLDSVLLDYPSICLAKLLSGCYVIEELVLINTWWNDWESCSVSSPTLKRLKLSINEDWGSPKSVTFDTPDLVYFEYSDTVARKYAKVNFGSLVEARLGLRVGREEIQNVFEILDIGYMELVNIEEVIVGDATDLLIGIRNVQILYLSASTLEVLNFCCKAIPIFKNLTHLTIESNPEVGWESLPDLLKNCPNLKTLIFQGLLHKATVRCGDVCRCYPSENIPSSLSSSSVKFLKILKFGETDDNEKEIEQIMHFLDTMPNLEQVILYYDTPKYEDVMKVSKQLEMLPRVASPKCKIQVISDNLNLSFTLPTSFMKK